MNIMEFGISTFGEITADNVAGGAKNAARRMRELVEENGLLHAGHSCF